MPGRERSPRRVNTDALVTQIEYYFSDVNLSKDKYFHGLISSNEGGWLKVQEILNCNNVRKMGANEEQIAEAISAKSKDVELRKVENTYELRRKGNKQLPALNLAVRKNPKVHDGGAVMAVKNVPAELQFMDLKHALSALLEKKAPGKKIWNVSTRNDEGTMIVCAEPFDDHVEFWDGLKFTATVTKAPEKAGKETTQKPEDIGKTFDLQCELLFNTELNKALKRVPPMIASRREQMLMKQRKAALKPIEVSGIVFESVRELRSKVREIMASRSNGEYLKEGGGDFKLVKFVVENYHPNKEKAKGLAKILVDVSTADNQTRCFHIEREDGTKEDFSILKCLAELEKNPPFKK